MKVNDLQDIRTAVTDLDEKRVLSLVEEALAAGEDSADIVHAVQDGLRTVGERYERKEIYLAGLIMAGEIFRGAMELAQPGLEDELSGNAYGRVLLGTVAGDIHDIGKNMAALAFRMLGFTVEDLGVNVSPETFLEAARQFKPDIVGMSGLLVVAFDAMQRTVTLFREHADELTVTPLFVIGGGTISEQVARYVGADLWTDDAMEGARRCQEALERRR
jgi:methylmalonyl-CoA mutase cobalamin-binding domain/chain